MTEKKMHIKEILPDGRVQLNVFNSEGWKTEHVFASNNEFEKYFHKATGSEVDSTN